MTNLNEPSLSWSELSRLLYDLDPAHTCCVENEALDEYDLIARAVVNRCHHEQIPLEKALLMELSEAFDCEEGDQVQQRVRHALFT